MWPLMSSPMMLVACSRASASFDGELHAAGLAPPADLHLRLEHDRVADAVRGRDRGLDVGHRLTG